MIRPARAACRRIAGPVASSLTATLALAACAPAPPPRTAAVPGPAAATPPWEIPAADLRTQRLFRVRYDGSAGEGVVKVTLRLAAADRYQVQAADPLGRSLWSIEAVAGHGLWLDHRSQLSCRLAGSLDFAGLPLAPFPLLTLPSLLLGRLPAAPATVAGRRAAVAPDAAALDFEDSDGRRWTATVERGRPTTWTLWGGGDGGADGEEPRISWLSAGREAILSDRGQGVQLRWRQLVVEPLAGALAPLAVPTGYREVDCRRAYE